MSVTAFAGVPATNGTRAHAEVEEVRHELYSHSSFVSRNWQANASTLGNEPLEGAYVHADASHDWNWAINPDTDHRPEKVVSYSSTELGRGLSVTINETLVHRTEAAVSCTAALTKWGE